METISRDVSVPLSRYCESSDTPITLGVYLRLKYGAYDELAMMEVRPEWYSKAYDYYIDRQAACWLSKMEDLPTSFDRQKIAVDSMLSCERECKRTNDRLSRYLLNGPYDPEDEAILKFIDRARRDIARLIGSHPPAPSFHFGPGATLSDRNGLVSVPFKICSAMTVTSGARWLMHYHAFSAWGRYGQKLYEIVDSNEFTTVPKNAKTDRGIEIQPSVNVSAQLGYGKHLRRRLKAAGVDLRSVADEHRIKARQASRDGSLATIDLKSASDTICRNLVKLLLPPAWYNILESLTNRRLRVSSDKTIFLERFSSMGNGFTFELETIIFRAIARAASSQPLEVSVFGDDIIVARDDARSVVSALRYFGFTTNQSKSYLAGRFRESCGGDYFDGFDVRPFYLKESPNDPQQLLSFANGVWRASRRLADDIHITPFHRSWLHIQDCLPSSIRACRGPEYFGDILLHDQPSKYNCRVVDGIEKYLVYHPNRFSGVGWARFCGDTQLAAALYGCRLARVGPNAAVDGVLSRNPVLSYTVTRC